MKKTLVKFAILFLTMSLAACSTNSRNENTGIGAVSGGVVGGVAGGLIAHNPAGVAIGAVAGALLGGFIGHNMDSSDNANMNSALSNNATNQSSSWKNRKTGAHYKVTPTSNTMSMNGNSNCRTYRATTMLNGKAETTKGAACMSSNGNWQTINA